MVEQVKQDRFGPVDGNCFPACVASLTGIALDELRFPVPEKGWFQVWVEVLKTFGYSMIFFPKLPEMDVTDGIECIAIGRNTANTCHHAVVLKLERSDKEVVGVIEHDPMGGHHLDIDSITSYVFLVKDL